MSMTFDDLCEVYQTAALALPDKGGIRAVVKALRDEMLNDMALHTSLIDSDDVTEWFNEILAQSEARQAGVLAVESREVAMVPEATEAPAADLYAVVGQSCDEVVSIRSAPAADPSPEGCVWTPRVNEPGFYGTPHGIKFRGGFNWTACPSCGKPIVFKEATK